LYTDPSRGSGWLRLENFVDSDVATLDNLVRTAEISRSIGSVDPARQEELPLGGAVVNRTSNPYFQIGLGIGAIVLGIACAIFPLAGLSSSGAAANVVLVIVALALIGVGIWVAIHGARRRSWWVAARAEARRTGQPLPDQLKVWN
jgi:hypothetical protein